MSEVMGTSQEKYIRFADKFRWAAENMFGMPIPNDAHFAWQTTLLALREVDNVIDSTTDIPVRRAFAQDAIQFMTDRRQSYDSGDEMLDGSLSELKFVLDSQTENARTNFLHTLSQLFEVTELVKKSTNAHELSYMKRVEGFMTSQLLLTLLPDSITTTDSYSDFIRWAGKLGSLGNSVDTIIDLPDDYSSGQIRIRPSLMNRATLASGAVRDGSYVLAKTDPHLVAQLAVSTMKLIHDRFNNK